MHPDSCRVGARRPMRRSRSSDAFSGFALSRTTTRTVSFYESDCQGRTSPGLIAGYSPPPWQSAFPSLPPRLSRGACGSANQSSFAYVTSAGAPDPSGTIKALCSHGGEPRFYLRLGCSGRPDAFSGPARGPGVRRVPRHDCGRANDTDETSPRTHVPDPWSCGQRSRGPTPPPHGSGAILRPAASVLPRRTLLLSSRCGASARRASGPG
jgi:hypothetical protein